MLLTSILLLPLLASVYGSADGDPCLESNQIEDITKLKLPKKFTTLSPPWIRNDTFNTKVYTSPPLQYQWSWMKSLTVRGLKKKGSNSDQHSIEDVLHFIDSHDCLVIPAGPTIRDLISRRHPVWLRAEVSCDISMLYKACIERYGSTPCALYPIEDGEWGDYRLEIGDSSSNSTFYEVHAEPLSFHPWGTLLGNTKKWTYSIEQLALFDDSQGGIYLLDQTGKGFDDTCQKKISPASEGENVKDWNKWSEDSLEKVLTYYLLKSNEYGSSTEQFQDYAKQRTMHLYNKKAAQTFYCEKILSGVVNWAGEGQTTTCHIVYPTNGKTRSIQTTKELMERELEKYWAETVGSAIDDLEAVFYTDSQFVEIRNRLKHRISSDADITPKPVVTHVIRDGRPMISDISDVHRRPIMKMSDTTPALPVEFPSGPHAKPDENLVFQQMVETSGFLSTIDPVAYETIQSGEVEATVDDLLVTQKVVLDDNAKEDESFIVSTENVEGAGAQTQLPRSAEARRTVIGEPVEYDVLDTASIPSTILSLIAMIVLLF